MPSPWPAKTPPLNDVHAELWRRGWLLHILHKEQVEAMEFLKGLKSTYAFLLCTRGFGKSYFLVAYYVWLCSMQRKRVWFLSATHDQVERIFEKHLEEIMIKYMPRDLWPKKVGNRHLWRFPNGSVIFMAGVDQTKGRSLRGDGVDAIICDEIGAWHECYGIIKGALYSIAERNGGSLIMSTTPPETAGHDSFRLFQEAKAANTVFVRDVFNCSLYTPERIAKIIEENQSSDDLEGNKRGIESTYFQREFMCQFVTEENKRVIPEFKAARHVVKAADWPETPKFCDAYAFMDLGFKAFTHYLLGYYNFKEATIYIMDEVVQNHANADNTTKDLANKIKAKEFLHFRDKQPTAPGKVAISRIADNELQLLNDLHREHQLYFVPIVKNFSKEAGNNDLRLWFQQERIKIHERCVKLITQLEVGIWNKRRDKYEAIDGCGNLDGIDALVYGTRFVDQQSNPVPTSYDASNDIIMNPFDYHMPEIQEQMLLGEYNGFNVAG